jgi:general secretion pathway protein M
MTVPAFLLGRKAALAGATLACAVVIFALFALSDWAVGGDEAPRAERLQRLAALQAEVASLPRLHHALVTLRREAASYPGLLRGDSDATTQAALQSDLKSIVEAQGGEVRSASPLPASDEEGLHRIAIQYDLTVPLSKLDDLIYAIESRTPYLFLDDVDIASPPWPSDAKAPEPRIEVRWTVSGYRKGGST